MPLYKHVRDDVNKFSFVEKTEFKGARFYIYYKDDGTIKYKVLPYRANKNQLLNCLESIKKEIGYYEKLFERNELIKDNLKKDFVVGVTHEK